MTTPVIDSGIYIEDDFVENIIAWFRDNIVDLTLKDAEPTIYYSQPNSEATFPSLFVYPASALSKSDAAYNVGTDEIGIIIDGFVCDEYWEKLNKELSRWAGRIRNVLLGVINLTGTASSGSTTTLVDDDLAGEYPDDHFNDLTLYTLTGTGSGQNLTVTGYTGATGTFTFATATAPDATTTYRVTGLSHWQRSKFLTSQKVTGTGFFPNVTVIADDGSESILGYYTYTRISFKGVKNRCR